MSLNRDNLFSVLGNSNCCQKVTTKTWSQLLGLWVFNMSTLTYKCVHLSLRVEGTYPFLQAIGSHMTRNYITTESIQTSSIEKRSGLFSDDVKSYSCEICNCYKKNRNLEQEDTFSFYQWFRSKSREVEQWLRSDTGLALRRKTTKNRTAKMCSPSNE